MFKKGDKKSEKDTFNLREIGVALNDTEGPVASSSGIVNESRTEPIFERNASASRPHTRESSRDRGSVHDNGFDDLVNDIRHDPAFAQTFDGLGRIIVGNIAQLKELSKKANVPYIKDLDNIILDYNDYKHDLDKAIESRINNHVDSTLGSIDKILNQKLLDRELAYHDQTETITPPTLFAENDVLLDNAAKISAANNAFPTKRKFSGSTNPGQPTIVEFLTNLNLAQKKCNLSQKEFTEYLNLCCTGEVFEDVACMIDCSKTLPEIYQSLLIQFDKRLKPKEAKKALDTYKPPFGASLNSVTSDIMKYGKRAALQYKKEAQSAAYDALCTQALIENLPESAQILAENCLNELNSRMATIPTFADLTRALTKYGSTIDRELRRYGRYRMERSNGHTYHSKTDPKQRNIRSAQINYIDKVSHGRNDLRDVRYRRGNGKEQPSNPLVKRNFNTNKRYRTQHPTLDTRQYNNNNNNRRNIRYSSYERNNRSSYPSNTGLSGVPHCSLCGKNNHKPNDVCYAMRDDSGKVVTAYPSQGPCGICKKQDVTLFHAPEVCFNRPIIKRLKEQGLLQWPTLAEREELKRYSTGKFNNQQ